MRSLTQGTHDTSERGRKYRWREAFAGSLPTLPSTRVSWSMSQLSLSGEPVSVAGGELSMNQPWELLSASETFREQAGFVFGELCELASALEGGPMPSVPLHTLAILVVDSAELGSYSIAILPKGCSLLPSQVDLLDSLLYDAREPPQRKDDAGSQSELRGCP